MDSAGDRNVLPARETHEGKAGTVTSQSAYPLALLNKGAMSYFYIMSAFLFVIFII